MVIGSTDVELDSIPLIVSPASFRALTVKGFWSQVVEGKLTSFIEISIPGFCVFTFKGNNQVSVLFSRFYHAKHNFIRCWKHSLIRVTKDLMTFRGEDNVVLWVFQRSCVLSRVHFDDGPHVQSIRYWHKETACIWLPLKDKPSQIQRRYRSPIYQIEVVGLRQSSQLLKVNRPLALRQTNHEP